MRKIQKLWDFCPNARVECMAAAEWLSQDRVQGWRMWKRLGTDFEENVME